jgi:signal-transduction protein with cAMP-binding, CBS, and nucleotidyltransferase domain
MMDGTMRHLLVKEGGTTVGILRLSEIFAMVSQKAFRTTID